MTPSGIAPVDAHGPPSVAVCATIYRMPGQAVTRSGTVFLAIPETARQAAEGRVARFRYERYDLEGVQSHGAECVIPYSPGAIRVATVRFSLKSALKDTLGDSGSSTTLSVAPLDVNDSSWPATDHEPDCDGEDECFELDPIRNYCADYPDDPECQDDEPPSDPDPSNPSTCDPYWDSTCDDSGGGSSTGTVACDGEYCFEERADHEQVPKCEDTGECTLQSYPDDESTFEAISRKIREFGPECEDIAERWDYIWQRRDGNVRWYEETVGNPPVSLKLGHFHHEVPWTPVHIFRGNEDYPRELDHWTKTAVHETMHVILWFRDGTLGDTKELLARTRQCAPDVKTMV